MSSNQWKLTSPEELDDILNPESELHASDGEPWGKPARKCSSWRSWSGEGDETSSVGWISWVGVVVVWTSLWSDIQKSLGLKVYRVKGETEGPSQVNGAFTYHANAGGTCAGNVTLCVAAILPFRHVTRSKFPAILPVCSFVVVVVHVFWPGSGSTHEA